MKYVSYALQKLTFSISI